MTMRLEHIALYTDDLEATRAFFVRYFGAVSNELYHNPRTGLSTYFLSFDGGARLEIMSRPARWRATMATCGWGISTSRSAWAGTQR